MSADFNAWFNREYSDGVDKWSKFRSSSVRGLMLAAFNAGRTGASVAGAVRSREAFEAWAKLKGCVNFMRMAGDPDQYDDLILRATYRGYLAAQASPAVDIEVASTPAAMPQPAAEPVGPPVTPKHIEEIKDLLLWPVTEDDARAARDMLQSLHFDLSMAAMPAAGLTDAKTMADRHFTPAYLLINCRDLLAAGLASAPNWAIAAELFALGSKSARKICVDSGIDPDAIDIKTLSHQRTGGGDDAPD